MSKIFVVNMDKTPKFGEKIYNQIWAFLTLSKMLWICSYLASKINSQKEFMTLNLSKIWAVLTIWTLVQIFGHCQKCSEFAQIGCDNFFVSWFHTPNRSKNWAFLTMSKISHFISTILGVVKNALIVLIFGVMNYFHELIL